MDAESRAFLEQATAETRRHFDVVAESLRDDIGGVAEGVVATNEAISRLRHEMNDRFRASEGLTRSLFSELKREIEELRAGR